MVGAVSVSDYRAVAQARLPHFLFEYIDGGSYAETSLRRNEVALEEVSLRQRVLCDVSAIDLSMTLFGAQQRMPVVLGPIGLAGMNARRGEVQAACAADQAGVPFCLSTVSVCPLAEVAGASQAPIWFQLYLMRDRAFVEALLRQAADAGCSTLVLTVDMPVPGTRYRDYRSGLAGAAGLIASARRAWQAASRPRWAIDVGLLGRPHHLGNVAPLLRGGSGLEDFLAWMRANFDPSATWDDLSAIREAWHGTLIVKGIMDAEDALQASGLGIDGIVVSNHGGRQLDGVPATATVLPKIAAAVGDRMTVLVDGGVRSGLDVVKMLALGADGVLLGRAWAWALAAAGERGVRQMLSLIEAEMRVAMALTGANNLADLNKTILI